MNVPNQRHKHSRERGCGGKGNKGGRQWLSGIMHKCQAIYSAPLGAVHATLCSISAAHSHPHYDRQCQHELLNHLSICTSLRVFWYGPPSLPSPPTLSLDLLQQLQPSSLKESPTNDDEVIGEEQKRRLGFTIWHNELSEISCALTALHSGWVRAICANYIHETVRDDII